jgi:hypothetical protein
MTIIENSAPVRGHTAEPPTGRWQEQTSFLPLAGASLEQRDRLRRALARLAALDAPHLSPLRRIAERPDGFSLMHCVPAGPVSWAELTARRPATVAETVAVGLAMCQALGALHAGGLAHGGVRADLVLVSPRGVVELAGCAGAWGTGTDGVPTSADDVRDLVVLLEAGFEAGTLGGELALLLVRGADPDPAQRPTVPALGRALEAQCSPVGPFPDDFIAPAAPARTGDGSVPAVVPPPGEAAAGAVPAVLPGLGGPVRTGVRRLRAGSAAPVVPVRGVPKPVGVARVSDDQAHAVVPGALRRGGARRHVSLPRRPRSTDLLRVLFAHPLLSRRSASDDPSPQRRSWGRPLLLGLAAVLGVVLILRGVTGLVGWGRDPVAVSGAPSALAGPGFEGTDWRGTVARLDAARMAAMAGGSAVRLAMAVDVGGPAYARDVATMTARAHAGLHLVGGAATVRSAVALEVGDERAEVEVVDTRADYRLVDPGGQVVLAGPARASASWRVSLVRDGSAQPWRIYDTVRR